MIFEKPKCTAVRFSEKLPCMIFEKAKCTEVKFSERLPCTKVEQSKCTAARLGLKLTSHCTIRGHKGQSFAETRCRGFLVLESQCPGFLTSEKMPWDNYVVP